jgi:glycosyltransferase involved in cell wall biosynthesis
MRYAWDQLDAYFGVERLGRWGQAAARHVLAPIARWDRDTAPRVTRFLANSAHVAGRIARYYNRQATVLHPPVDTGFFTPGADGPGRYFLVVSALVPYKRIDTAIRAAALMGAPLKIIGTGPDAERLHALAGPDVEFAGHVDDSTLRTLYRGARAVLLPGEEDFGISPVEAQACGRPVVALGRGGALETVEHGVSGFLVDDESPAAFADAMNRVDALPLSPADWQARAAAFGIANFERGFTARVAETMAGGGQW